MPSLQTDLYAPLTDTGFTLFGIHVGDDVAFAISVQKDLGLQFPMLIDFDSSVLRKYQRWGAGHVLFPLGYLAGKSLKIKNIYTVQEPPLATLKATIESLLAQ